MASQKIFLDSASAPLLPSRSSLTYGSDRSVSILGPLEPSPSHQSATRAQLDSFIADSQADVSSSINAMRGFVIARHPKHGYLILKSYKKDRGE